jgi:2-polyprenyl-3-methyl-5-hydroxy-6-metoxy-1,4-benzoquinol methylase
MMFTHDYWIPDLSHRAESVELMDDTTTDERPLFATLRDFIYINRFVARIQRVLRETIIADIKRRKAREVSLLDIAAGGCDAGLWFARYCRNCDIKCSVFCLDHDPRALRYARDACRHEPSISFIESDARSIASLNLMVDYSFTNHFLHHLPDQDIPGMLRAIRDCCRYGFVVNDLHRHVVWHLGFTLLGSILWRNGFTLADGRMSIRRGFKRAELESYIIRAGIDATVARSGLGHWRITNIRSDYTKGS